MRSTLQTIVAAAGLVGSSICLAQAPAGAPADAAGLCKDGTYSTAAVKKGACKGHKGVKEWYADTSKPGAAPAGAPAAPASTTPASKAAAAPASAPSAAASAAAAPAAPTTKTASAAPAAPAPGGGPGQVWVNTKSKIYHCQDDKWYGKTKEGQYMMEAEATAKGYRAERGKACK